MSTIPCSTVWFKIVVPYEAPLQGAVANLPDVVGSLSSRRLDPAEPASSARVQSVYRLDPGEEVPCWICSAQETGPDAAKVTTLLYCGRMEYSGAAADRVQCARMSERCGVVIAGAATEVDVYSLLQASRCASLY